MNCFLKIVDAMPFSNEHQKCIYKMLCCSFCNAKKEEKPIDKRLELLITPLFIMHHNLTVQEELPMIMKMFDINHLGTIKDSFMPSNDENEELSKLVESLNSFLSNKESFERVDHFLREVHEATYLELVRQQVYSDNYKLLLILINLYFISNITVSGHGFFNNVCYRSKSTDQKGGSIDIDPTNSSAKYVDVSLDTESVLLSFGRSLDEGYTEQITQQLMDRMFSDNKERNQSSVYYTEIQFIQKIEAILGKDAVMQAYFNTDLSIFYNLVKCTDNPCDYYNLYYHTDNQNWKSAIDILKRIKEYQT